MSASGSGPRTRADAAKEADDTDNAPPAPLSVQMRGQHRAAWLTETELAIAAPQDTITAGEPHARVHLALGYALHHNEFARELKVQRVDDISTYDPTRNARIFAAPPSGSLDCNVRLPSTISLCCGDTFVVNSVKDVYTPGAIKYDSTTGCTCVRPGNAGRFTKREGCKTCALRVRALLQRADGTTHTLEAAGYATGLGSTHTDVILSMLLLAKKADGTPVVPPHFAPARPRDSNIKTVVSEAESGFPASHAHPGCRGVVGFQCGFLKADGKPCGAEMSVTWRDDDEYNLRVSFAHHEHEHAAGLCARALTARCDASCLDWGCSPLAEPAGVALPSLYAAALLRRGSDFLQSVDSGRTQSPQMQWYAAVRRAPRLAVLHRNTIWYGTARSQEAAFEAERGRVLLRQGAPVITPEAAGGPRTSAGRDAELLRGLAIAHATEAGLGPMLMARYVPFLAVLLSTPLRLRQMAALQRVPFYLARPWCFDTTGGMVVVDGREVTLVVSLPEAAGGGRMTLATMTTDTKREYAMKTMLDELKNTARYSLGVNLKPAMFVVDQDDGGRNSISLVFNGCTHAEHTAHMIRKLESLTDLLAQHNLLGVPLDPDNPPPVALPLLGFGLGADGTALPDLRALETLLFLCVWHFLRQASDYIMHTSPFFKHLPIDDKRFWSNMHMNLVYFAVVSPLFAGPESYVFFKAYMEEVEEVLGLGQVLPLGVAFEGLVVTARTRTATPADKLPGKPAPKYVFEVLVRGVVAPVITIRLKGALGDADGAEVDADASPEAQEALRAALLACLPDKGKDAYKDVPTEELSVQAGYTPAPPPPQEASDPADDAADEAAAEGDGAGGSSGAAAATAAAGGADAGGSGTAPPPEAKVQLLHPLHMEVKRGKKVEFPVLRAWKVRCADMLMASPVLRKGYDQLAIGHNIAADGELAHRVHKHQFHDKAQFPMQVGPFTASMMHAMETEDAGIAAKLAGITDTVTARSVRNRINGHGGRGGAAAAGEEDSDEEEEEEGVTAAPAAPADAKRKGKGKAKAKALPKESIMAAPGLQEHMQAWGKKRAAPPRVTGAAGLPSAADAPMPAPPSIFEMLRSQRVRCAPAAAALAAAQAADVTRTVSSLQRAQVGDSVAATALRHTEAAANAVREAQAELQKRLAVFNEKAREAATKAATGRQQAGFVSPDAADAQPLLRRAHPRAASAGPPVSCGSGR